MVSIRAKLSVKLWRGPVKDINYHKYHLAGLCTRFLLFWSKTVCSTDILPLQCYNDFVAFGHKTFWLTDRLLWRYNVRLTQLWTDHLANKSFITMCEDQKPVSKTIFLFNRLWCSRFHLFRSKTIWQIDILTLWCYDVWMTQLEHCYLAYKSLITMFVDQKSASKLFLAK